MQSSFDIAILFLIFNRPDTTEQVFQQIRKARPTYLFVAADGPRGGVPGEKERCSKTRSIIDKVDWPCEVKTYFRNENLGCGPAVSTAITWFFNHVTEGIILEDDCFPDPSFFPYCQELLEKYRHTEHIKLIGGNNFQDGVLRGHGSYYFSHYPEIWGWASWRRVWQEYDFTMSGLEEGAESQVLQNLYKSAEEHAYWRDKFFQTKKGIINTWDYQLVYSILKNKGLAISPQVNLVKNIGIDNNPTHVSLRDSKKNLVNNTISFPLKHPDIMVDKEADEYTFLQIYSRAPRRLLRLIRENGIKTFVISSLSKLFR
ncbi:MAG: hypothetical protein WKF70_04990 [Chitinophagaceae bacterium]